VSSAQSADEYLGPSRGFFNCVICAICGRALSLREVT
jgi:hypothetical protein